MQKVVIKSWVLGVQKMMQKSDPKSDPKKCPKSDVLGGPKMHQKVTLKMTPKSVQKGGGCKSVLQCPKNWVTRRVFSPCFRSKGGGLLCIYRIVVYRYTHPYPQSRMGYSTICSMSMCKNDPFLTPILYPILYMLKLWWIWDLFISLFYDKLGNYDTWSLNRAHFIAILYHMNC
jgi:hypothetical protein